MAHVLVIDDEEPIVKMLSLALTKAGFYVDAALSGEEGIDKYDRSRFDLVITDVKMPGITGKSVVRHIQNSSRPDTPVVGISGTPWELVDEEFDAVLAKPFSLKSLYGTIDHLCCPTLTERKAG